MSGITFLSENYTDSAEYSITTGTENAQFPLENLRNDSPSVKFRGVGSVAVIVFDLLQTRDIDYIAVAADPLESFLVNTITAKTSVTTDFSSSPVYPIAISMGQTIGYGTFTEVTHRYVELTITGSGGFTELGKVFVGKGLNLPLNSVSIDSFKYQYDDKATIRQNKYGQKFIDKTNQTKVLGGEIQYCTKEEQETLDDMAIRHGESYPLWMILDPNNEAMNEGEFKLMIYGYNEGTISWSASGGQLYSISVQIKQAI
jgi:hypothetical protein